MARMAPLLGSIAITAPISAPSWACAKSCSCWSMVSVTSRGCGWRARMSFTRSLSGFVSLRPVSRSSQARSTPAEPVDDPAGGTQPPLGVEDRATQCAAPRGDDLRVVLAAGEDRCVEHLPPGQADGHDGEGQDQVARQAADVGGDHGDGSPAANALRWLIESSRPTTRNEASRLDPP